MLLALVCTLVGTQAIVAQPIRVGPGVTEAVERGDEPVVVVALQRPAPDLRGPSNREAAVRAMQSDVLSSLSPADFSPVHQFRAASGLVLVLHDPAALDALESHPAVRRIDLDVGGSGSLDQSRPWIGADAAQSMGLLGAGQTIAVLDSGIDSDHPDLRLDLIHEHCQCNTGVNCCPTGGGVADGPGSAEDDHGHGTHVSGIITGDGSVGPLGIAPAAGIVAVKVLDSNNGFNSSSDITAALEWVLASRPDVDAVNMSLGTFARFTGDCDNAAAWTMVMADAVNALRAAGVPSFAAASNDSDKTALSAPACLSGAIAVGATDDDADLIMGFSNSSPSLDVLAPGNTITSSRLGGGVTTLTGTSMATPHAAAVTALLAEHNPTADAAALLDCLATSPVQLTDSNGITRPRIDVPSALDACVGGIEVCGGVDERLNSRVLAGESILCTASRSIRLVSGFGVEQGGQFRARIN